MVENTKKKLEDMNKYLKESKKRKKKQYVKETIQTIQGLKAEIKKNIV